MTDQRARHFRRLRKLRRSARRWSVLAGGLGGAAAVLTPYAGLGLADAAWTAAAGASAALALWRWSDLRALAARPAPPPSDPALVAQQRQARLIGALESWPVGAGVVAEVRRHRVRLALRGTAAAQLWDRLDRAAQTLSGLAGRLTGPAEAAVRDAADAEYALRGLADRLAGLQRVLRFAPDDARASLESVHRELLTQLDGGVAAYERLVTAVAGYLAEEGHGAGEHPAVVRLTEASDLLQGIAAGLAELRDRDGSARSAY